MPTAVDLFCGAGGLAAGFGRCEIEVVLASDCWRPAADTYRANFPGHRFAEVDIRDLDAATIRAAHGGRSPDIVAGGPPCQGFSSAGARAVGDHRNTLVGCYARLAAELRPAVVVFENVEGFLTAEAGKYVQDLLDPLVEAGYTIRIAKLNVANYGVPQLRKRVIGIASLQRIPESLVPTHSAHGAPGVWRVGHGRPRTATLAEVLALPLSGQDRLAEIRWPTGIEKRRIEALRQGQTMRDLPDELRHVSYHARAHRRVCDGTPTDRRGGPPAGLRRLVADEPSKAITGAATREFVHPTQNRTLCLREAANIQTFPGDFQFLGTKADIATLIGNAIPPVFAAALARAALDTLAQSPDAGVSPGLVEFLATNATAMSPLLARVVAMVRDRYLPRAATPTLLPATR
ncbi:MAG: DNA cytosine methyltransferase [Micrococcales bacterium]|nr:DNA cytosine methyltransferase [Micrococcales bacterium]